MAAQVARRGRRRGPPLHFLAVFIGPSLLLYGAFVLWPAINAFLYSLLRWDGLGKPVYVGLKNFRSIVAHGSQFAVAFGHNVFLTVVPGALILALAL
ncbi:MAG: sugar ABC transporter permease, partial [Armatimonadetes bacterium]|nr:sugar ABC transporter permease [Armatimonadota bacterium]